MAQEHIESVIGQFRRLHGDIWRTVDSINTEPEIITDYLNEDSNAWTAQALADMAVMASNKILETVVQQSKSPDVFGRLVPEALKRATLTVSGGSGNDHLAVLPSDFGWLVAAGIKFSDGSYMVANTDDPFRTMYATRQGLVETVGTPTGYIEGTNIVIVYSTGIGGGMGQIPFIDLTYLALQPAIEVGGSNTDDLLLSTKWDESLLQLMFNQARFYKQ